MEADSRKATQEPDYDDDTLEQPPSLGELRRKSFVSTSVVSADPSLEQSKEWINTYLEGGAEEDDFHRKFFEGGHKVDPVSASTQANQILKEENVEPEDSPKNESGALVETYEEVLTHPGFAESGPRKRGSDATEHKEEMRPYRSNKSIEHHKRNGDKECDYDEMKQIASADKIMEKSLAETIAPKSTPQTFTPVQITEFAASESTIKSPGLPLLKKQRTKSISEVKNEAAYVKPIQSDQPKVMTGASPIVKLHSTIKIKIFDLSLVHERYMNKTHDEVRNNFLKTLLVKQKMPEIFVPKPATKEQKSSLELTSHHLRLGRHSFLHVIPQQSGLQPKVRPE